MKIDPAGSARGAGSVRRSERTGATRPGGDFPVNTYGGLLSFGHTGDSSGLSMIVEGARQVMGIAGDRQLQRADIGIVHSYGGMMSEHSTLILGRQS